MWVDVPYVPVRGVAVRVFMVNGAAVTPPPELNKKEFRVRIRVTIFLLDKS